MTKKELDHRRYLKIKDTSAYKTRNARGTRQYAVTHPEWARDHARGSNGSEYRVRVKIEVLSHYGPAGKLQCAWPDCTVTDIDMLSLDHVLDDGAQERKNGHRGGGGIATYQRVRKAEFPDGYQTLCHNHQWKKELMRRRA
jgi:hypothetical protein